jgi:hypothetical protein
MHRIVLAAINHYYKQIFVNCECEVCIALKILEDLVSTADLEIYIKTATLELEGEPKCDLF